MLGPDGVMGLRVLDLYAGTGAFGIEALSRGARFVAFVDSDARRCREITASVRELGYEARAAVHTRDAVAAIRNLTGPFDLVFADPPYGQEPFLAVLGELDRSSMLAEGALVLLEHAARSTLPDPLPGVRRISTRKYGDTAVTVYRRQTAERGAGDDDSPDRP